jgi:hypothetical protein
MTFDTPALLLLVHVLLNSLFRQGDNLCTYECCTTQVCGSYQKMHMLLAPNGTQEEFINEVLYVAVNFLKDKVANREK